MVEHVHFDRAGKFPDHPLDFGVINSAHFIGVVKIRDRRVLTRDRKALAVERQLAHDRAGAVNRHGELCVGSGPRGDARRRFEVVAHGMLIFVGEIVEHAVDVIGTGGALRLPCCGVVIGRYSCDLLTLLRQCARRVKREARRRWQYSADGKAARHPETAAANSVRRDQSESSLRADGASFCEPRQSVLAAAVCGAAGARGTHLRRRCASAWNSIWR